MRQYIGITAYNLYMRATENIVALHDALGAEQGASKPSCILGQTLFTKAMKAQQSRFNLADVLEQVVSEIGPPLSQLTWVLATVTDIYLKLIELRQLLDNEFSHWTADFPSCAKLAQGTWHCCLPGLSATSDDDEWMILRAPWLSTAEATTARQLDHDCVRHDDPDTIETFPGREACGARTSDEYWIEKDGKFHFCSDSGQWYFWWAADEEIDWG